jgi:hypothetical protein
MRGFFILQKVVLILLEGRREVYPDDYREVSEFILSEAEGPAQKRKLFRNEGLFVLKKFFTLKKKNKHWFYFPNIPTKDSRTFPF